MSDDVARIGLSDEQREAWVWTVLAATATETQRFSFICGYNGYDCPAPRTAQKLEYHRRGLAVRGHLVEARDA